MTANIPAYSFTLASGTAALLLLCFMKLWEYLQNFNIRADSCAHTCLSTYGEIKLDSLPSLMLAQAIKMVSEIRVLNGICRHHISFIPTTARC